MVDINFSTLLDSMVGKKWTCLWKKDVDHGNYDYSLKDEGIIVDKVYLWWFIDVGELLVDLPEQVQDRYN